MIDKNNILDDLILLNHTKRKNVQTILALLLEDWQRMISAQATPS